MGCIKSKSANVSRSATDRLDGRSDVSEIGQDDINMQMKDQPAIKGNMFVAQNTNKLKEIYKVGKILG